MNTELRFMTKNADKFRELQELIDPSKYTLIEDRTEINELQTENMDVLVRDKVLKAFEIIRRPLIVDHTGLEFDWLDGFPAGLTSVFYDKVKAKGFARIIGKSPNPKVTAVTVIGFCDGKQIHSFEGRLRGVIAEDIRGTEGFQWDYVFIPDGYNQTFSELGNKKKNQISMRRLAFNKFAKFLDGRSHA